MLIAILQFELLIHDAQSLKDKRRIVASLKDRIHRNHQASVAETGLLDTMRAARLGVAVAGTDAKYLSSVLDRILDRVRSHSHEAELGDTFREIISDGTGRALPEEASPDDSDPIGPHADLDAELLARFDDPTTDKETT